MHRRNAQWWQRFVTLIGLAAVMLGMVPVHGFVAAAQPQTIGNDPIQAVEYAVQQRSTNGAAEYVLVSPTFEQIGEWALIPVALLDGPVGDGEPSGGLLALAREQEGGWVAALEDSATFALWMPEVPETLLSSEAKAVFHRGAGIQNLTQPAFGLPFPEGERWLFSGGPHGGGVRPALDFARNSGSIRASADGVVSIPCPNTVMISHGNGWQSGYYHVRNIAVKTGQVITRGTHLGLASVDSGCGGGATGDHVHFWTVLNGVAQPANQLILGGWRPENGSDEYAGCLLRGTTRICAGGWITNDGLIGDSSIPPGAGAPTLAIAEAFRAAYERVGGATAIDAMTNRVHTWDREDATGTELLVQNFREAAAWNGEGDDDNGTIVYHPTRRQAYVLHGHIEDLYSSLGGPTSWLGYPIEDETILNDGAFYDFERGMPFQRFDRGFIGLNRTAGRHEAHTYYPQVAQPQISAEWIDFTRTRVTIEVAFDRAPGWPATDPVEVRLIWDAGAGREVRPAELLGDGSARFVIEAPTNRPIAYAIEVDNRGHNTSKRGSYPPLFSADGATMAGFSADMRLGTPPAANGQHWNRWDAAMIAAAQKHNLPPELLKLMLVLVSDGLGTRDGADPSLAYEYIPTVDAQLQPTIRLLQWLPNWSLIPYRSWLQPDNPAPNDRRPCAAYLPDGYAVPTGATAADLLTLDARCRSTADTGGLALDFVAQYRIAARYGLGRIPYSSYFGRLIGVAPEELYTPEQNIDLVAQKLAADRNRFASHLTAANVDMAAWAPVITAYNGNSADPARLQAWREQLPTTPSIAVTHHSQGAGAAETPTGAATVPAELAAFAADDPQPNAATFATRIFLPMLVGAEAATAMLAAPTADPEPWFSVAAAQVTVDPTTPAEPAPSFDPTQPIIVAALVAALEQDGPERLITLEQRLDGAGDAIVRVHTGAAPTDPVEWTSPSFSDVGGIGALRVVTVATLAAPVLVVDLPLGFQGYTSRLFGVQNDQLRELPVDGATGIYSSDVPAIILNDGAVIAGAPGATIGTTDTTVHLLSETGATLAETITTTAGADTAAPELQITPSQTANAAGWIAAPVTLTPQISDAASGLRNVGLVIRRNNTVVDQFSGRTLEPFTLEEDGRYDLSVTAVDFAGNQQQLSLAIQIDRTAPQTPFAITGLAPTLTLTADDNAGSGIALVECSADGNQWAPCSPPLAADTALRVRATDNADNVTVRTVHNVGITPNHWWINTTRGPQPRLRTHTGERIGEAGVCADERTVAVQPGQLYRAEVLVLQSSPTMTATLELVWQDDRLRTLRVDRISGAPGAAERLEIERSAPERAAFVKVELRAAGTGTVQFAKAAVRDQAGVNLLVHGDFSTETLTGWRPWRWSGAPGRITLTPRTDAAGMALQVSIQPTWLNDQALEVLSRNAATQAELTLRERMQLPLHGAYNLAVSMQGIDLTGQARVRLYFHDAAGKRLGVAESTAFSADFGWQLIELSGVAPEGTAYGRIAVQIVGRGTLWIDRVALSAE